MSDGNGNGLSENWTPEFEAGPAAQLVMEDMGIEEREGGIWMFKATCVGFTVESKAQAGSYQNVRGYQQFDANFHLVLPIQNPHKLVNDAVGNLDLLAQAYRTIARALDLTVFQVAGERVDLQALEAGKQHEVRVRRIDAGRKVRKPEPAGEVL